MPHTNRKRWLGGGRGLAHGPEYFRTSPRIAEPLGVHVPAQPQSLGTGSASSLPPWGLQSEAGPPQEPRPIGGQRFEAFPHLRPLALRGTSCDGIRR